MSPAMERYLDNPYDDPPARHTHRSVDIWYGGDICGEIVGGSRVGAMTEYWVKFGNKTVSPTLYSMKEAKRWARENLFQSKG